MRKTRQYSFLSDNQAVSEIMGSMLLLIIAVIFFAALLLYIFPLPFPPESPHVDLAAWIQGEHVIIENKGGNPLPDDTIVIITYPDGTRIRGTLTSSSYLFRDTSNNRKWDIGEFVFYELQENVEQLRLMVVDVETNSLVLDGVLKPSEIPGYPLLVTSLLTNTSDEDLICYGFLADDSDFNTVTRIYQWYKNGEPLTQFYTPFDTCDNNSTKDYSGYDNNGTIVDTSWINQGKLGGAYQFNGSQDHIEFNLPLVLDDIPNNDFTISLWLNSSDIDDPWREAIEARDEDQHSIQIFQYGSSIHFGVTDSGERRAVKSGRLQTDEWYHVVGVWNSNENSLELFINGERSILQGNQKYGSGPGKKLLYVGQGPPGSRNWKGNIDEIKIYPYALSDEQIYQGYLNTKDGVSSCQVIVSQETNSGDLWSCQVTPNNLITDDESKTSNSLILSPYQGGK